MIASELSRLPPLVRTSRARPALLAASTLALLSCANPRADEALFAQKALVGMPKQTLLSCAGVPERSTSVDNMEFFTYTSQRTVTYASPSPWFGRYPGYTYGYPYYGWPDMSYDVRTFSCQATFTLRNGVVERLVYGGAEGTGPSQLAQCQAILENCLALVPHPAPASASTPAPAPVPK